MAREGGFGKKLTRIFDHRSIISSLYGYLYSAVVTIAPMVLIIVNIVAMGFVLGYSRQGYAARELLTSTMLYQFIFSLMSAAPFNAVLFKYTSDIIYMEQYEEIWTCYYAGFFCQTLFSGILGIPFCLLEYFVGHIDILYILVGFCGYMALSLIFYNMIYLSVVKDYSKMSLFYFEGMACAFLLSLLFAKIFHWEVTFSMLCAMTCGYLIIAVLEYAQMKQYFKEQGRDYKRVFLYMLHNWKLIAANALYIIGLYAHNFVFWTTDLKKVVRNVFVSADPYDMASFLALLTCITTSIIFIVRIEMYFHDRYRDYSEAVIGGRGRDIRKAQVRMFRQLSGELVELVRVQFIISVSVFLVFIVFLPQFGYSGLIMQIYPCLAAGYFVMFMMYALLIFIYYYNDMNGALMTSLLFSVATLLLAILSTRLEPIWYGLGLTGGAMAAWTFGYFRLRWIERHLDEHIFCNGRLIEPAKGRMPDAKVYDRYDNDNGGEKKKRGKKR